MTNKEILQADLLDILFEHRNKLYGAYALRKTYTHRLGLALGVALSSVLLFVCMSFINKGDKSNGSFKDDRSIKLIDLDMQKDEIKDPEPLKEKPKPQPAQVDYQPPKIVEDDKVERDIADITDIQNANIGDQDIDGDKPDDLAKTNNSIKWCRRCCGKTT